MLKEYDIDTLNPRPNPYAKELRQKSTSQETNTISNIANSEKMDSRDKSSFLVMLQLFSKIL